MTTDNQTIKKTKVLEGIVVSDKMDKTVVVEVARFIKHPKYGKFVTLHKKIKAHDEDNTCKVGQKVFIRMTKPFSKDKSFEVIK